MCWGGVVDVLGYSGCVGLVDVLGWYSGCVVEFKTKLSKVES